ncbi:MAG: hypothetical protein V9G24_15055 [Rhodoblastus sp.]
MALALAVETCWPTTIQARPAKPGSRRRSGGWPAVSSMCVDTFRIGFAQGGDGKRQRGLVEHERAPAHRRGVLRRAARLRGAVLAPLAAAAFFDAGFLFAATFRAAGFFFAAGADLRAPADELFALGYSCLSRGRVRLDATSGE